MPLSAFEISSAIASPIAPTITSRAPAKAAEDQTATPIAIRSAAGRMPSSATAPPIAMLPVICWPQRSRKIEAERFRVPTAPVPSIAITGTARKVTSAQAMPTRRAAIWPPIPPWFSSRPITRLIAVLTAAQPQIWLKRLRETARPSATVTSGLAAEDHVGGGGEADAEVEADDAEHVDADHEQRDRRRRARLPRRGRARARS